MEYIKLSDKSIYISDGNYSAKYPRAEEMVDAGIPFITPANFEGDKISLKGMNYITKEKHSVLQKGHIKENDVLITVRGNNGRVMMVTSDFENANINAQLAFIRTDCSKIFPKYIYYYFNSNIAKLYISKNETGIALKQFPIKKLLEVTIPLVSKDKQQEIVSILDKINAIIDADKKQLKLLDETVKSRFIEMFDGKYETKPLSEVCEELFAGGDVKKDKSSDKQSELFPYPIYTNGEKDNGLYGYTSLVRVSKEAVTISGRGTIGFTCLRKEPFYPAVRLIVAVPNQSLVNGCYLQHFIKSKNYGGQGASIPQLTVPMIKNELIPLPPIRVQKEFQKYVELIDKSKFNIQQHLNLMQELLDKKMDEYFGG